MLYRAFCITCLLLNVFYFFVLAYIIRSIVYGMVLPYFFSRFFCMSGGEDANMQLEQGGEIALLDKFIDLIGELSK